MNCRCVLVPIVLAVMSCATVEVASFETCPPLAEDAEVRVYVGDSAPVPFLELGIRG